MSTQTVDASRLISKSEYARRRGVTPAQVTHWSKAGRIKIVDGKVDAKASDAMLRGSLNPLQGGKRNRHDAKPKGESPGADNAATIQQPEVTTAAIADKEASTALKRLKLEHDAGRLVDRRQYDMVTETVWAGLRDQLLGISRRIGSRLAAEADVQVCMDMVSDEITKVLNATAESQEAFADRVGETTQ